jgi:hydroxymethylpyrimidine/phosphomethylpyrimidine kinase
VLDPVMVAKGGDRLLAEEAVATIRSRLLPRTLVLTPNLPEAAVLLDRPEPSSRDQMSALAEALRDLGPTWVLLKGGHLSADDSPDYLAGPDGGRWLEGPRFGTANTHGTGCTLSSALAARLAISGDVPTAAREAKAYVSAAIAAADQLDVGSGHGPTNHFALLWAGR